MVSALLNGNGTPRVLDSFKILWTTRFHHATSTNIICILFFCQYLLKSHGQFCFLYVLPYKLFFNSIWVVSNEWLFCGKIPLHKNKYVSNCHSQISVVWRLDKLMLIYYFALRAWPLQIDFKMSHSKSNTKSYWKNLVCIIHNRKKSCWIIYLEKFAKNLYLFL